MEVSQETEELKCVDLSEWCKSFDKGTKSDDVSKAYTNVLQNLSNPLYNHVVISTIQPSYFPHALTIYEHIKKLTIKLQCIDDDNRGNVQLVRTQLLEIPIELEHLEIDFTDFCKKKELTDNEKDNWNIAFHYQETPKFIDNMLLTIIRSHIDKITSCEVPLTVTILNKNYDMSYTDTYKRIFVEGCCRQYSLRDITQRLFYLKMFKEELNSEMAKRSEGFEHFYLIKDEIIVCQKCDLGFIYNGYSEKSVSHCKSCRDMLKIPENIKIVDEMIAEKAEREHEERKKQKLLQFGHAIACRKNIYIGHF